MKTTFWSRVQTVTHPTIDWAQCCCNSEIAAKWPCKISKFLAIKLVSIEADQIWIHFCDRTNVIVKKKKIPTLINVPNSQNNIKCVVTHINCTFSQKGLGQNFYLMGHLLTHMGYWAGMVVIPQVHFKSIQSQFRLAVISRWKTLLCNSLDSLLT